MSDAVRDTGRRAAQLGRRTGNSGLLDGLARLGLAARGLVYVIVGWLAIQVALGGGDRQTDRTGALNAIAAKPFGRLLLLVLALGFAGYALWQLTEAAYGHNDEDKDAKRTAKRLSSLGKGLLYGTFCVSALRLATGSGGGGGDKQQPLTARVLSVGGGRFLVGLVGVAVICGGGYLAVSGLRQKFEDKLDTQRMSEATRKVAEAVGTVGLVARGVVFALAGLFLVQAAVTFDPRRAKGLDATLQTIAARPYGLWLLGVTAFGLLAFGFYSFIEAVYRRL